RELHIHKQTLAYRIKRIEEILDCQLNDVESVTRIWMALRACDFIDVDTPHDVQSSGRPTPTTP
ncbi:MAG: helix-turn-helix domain-containing protein, partial [Actinomycetes bacterium]